MPQTLAEVAAKLLPPGRAWTRRAGAVLTQLLAGATDELERVEGHVQALGAETITGEDLGRWATAMGLDGALPETALRAAIVRQLIGTVDLSRAAYAAAATALGLQLVDVLYWSPFEAGRSSAGEPVRGDAWLHDVRLVVAGGSADARAALDVVVNATLRRAHTRVTVQEGVSGAEDTLVDVYYTFQNPADETAATAAIAALYAASQPGQNITQAAVQAALDAVVIGAVVTYLSTETPFIDPAGRLVLGYVQPTRAPTLTGLEINGPDGLVSHAEMLSVHAAFVAFFENKYADESVSIGDELIPLLESLLPGASFTYVGTTTPEPGSALRLGGFIIFSDHGQWHPAVENWPTP